jgi:prophage antirepressor-like protein
VTLEGNPWFVATDVFKVFGLDVGGTAGGATKRLTYLDASEKQTVRRGEEKLVPLFAGQTSPAFTLISESGLYKLIMRSDKPQARAFQDWVTSAGSLPSELHH